MTNTTYRIAPWADVLFAMDKDWWDHHRAEVALQFTGARVSTNPIPPQWGVRRLPGSFKAYANSGAGAVALAVAAGATRVVMLGYDCQHTDGRTHWHGSHPRGLGDAGSIHRWPQRFAELARDVADRAEVLNASRATALECFPRMELEKCLALH